MKKTHHNISKVAAEIIATAGKFYKPTASKGNSLTFKVKDVKAEVNRQLSLRATRMAANEFKDGKLVIPTIRQLIWYKYTNKGIEIAKNHIPESGHSMGCIRNISIKGFGFFCSFDNRQQYAKSYKYAPTHGSLTLSLSAKEFLSLVKKEIRYKSCYVLNPSYSTFGRLASFSVNGDVVEGLEHITVIDCNENKFVNSVFLTNAYLYKEEFILKTDSEANAIERMNDFIVHQVTKLLTKK